MKRYKQLFEKKEDEAVDDSDDEVADQAELAEPEVVDNTITSIKSSLINFKITSTGFKDSTNKKNLSSTSGKVVLAVDNPESLEGKTDQELEDLVKSYLEQEGYTVPADVYNMMWTFTVSGDTLVATVKNQEKPSEESE